MKSVIAMVFTLLLAAHAAWAAQADSAAADAAADAALEKHVMAIAEELRCLVCQNQSLADSHADLAMDLKNQVREKLKQGMSERAIIDYMVERYGDFVLYRPPVKGTTFLLWFGPPLLLAAGLAALFVRLARRRASVSVALSESDQARARALIEPQGGADGR